jgi:Fe-S cluster biogenesis protein NfuA/nitrite reductase/ring-hydroxylating ferredoxin subunit
MLEVAKGVAPEGQKVYDALARDDIVRGFLLIHGLHPLDLRTRLSEALDKVRPYIRSHGGDVELISLQDDVARLRLIGHCKSCPSSAVTLELAVGQAIEEACPDLLGFEVEGLDTAPLNSASPAAQNLYRDWIVIDGAQQLSNGDLMPVQASGVALLICKVNRELYAYRDRCPACNLPLHLGALDGGFLSCRTGHRYDVQRAGRGVADADRHLDPFPLLVENGTVRVALALQRGPLAASDPALLEPA